MLALKLAQCANEPILRALAAFRRCFDYGAVNLVSLEKRRSCSDDLFCLQSLVRVSA
jgi:hypothetical protein